MIASDIELRGKPLSGNDLILLDYWKWRNGIVRNDVLEHKIGIVLGVARLYDVDVILVDWNRCLAGTISSSA